MNEKGLVASLLYLADADYGKADGKPMLSISAWPQYVLDNFATVAEAVETLRTEPFRLGAPAMPTGDAGSVHLAISDPTGDSAIFEYIGGKLVIHHGRQYQVMTNEPPFDQQLALNAYWQEIGGATFLPGTIRPADRFVRAYYLVTSIPKSAVTDIIPAVPSACPSACPRRASPTSPRPCGGPGLTRPISSTSSIPPRAPIRSGCRSPISTSARERR